MSKPIPVKCRLSTMSWHVSVNNLKKGEKYNGKKFDEYRRACLKAVEYQLGFQRPDGGYIWDENGKDNFHKQPYSWQLQGRYAEAHKLLNWVKKNTLQSDGQLKDYNGDVYKHIWLFREPTG